MRVASGAELVGVAPLRDVAAALVAKQRVLLDHWLECSVLVSEDYDVPVRLVAEEVENAELLHPARDEGQRRFAVLHAKVERLVAAGQPAHLVIGKAKLTKDRFDDLGECQV